MNDTPTRSTTVRRNIEIQRIYQFLKNDRRHDGAYCLEYIKRCYFLEDTRIYLILGHRYSEEVYRDFDEQGASIQYKATMHADYHELFSI